MEKLKEAERDIQFKALLSEIDSLIKKKEYDSAFKSTNKANLFLTHFADDPLVYLLNMMEIKSRKARICYNEKPAHYDYYILAILEEFALEIAKDIIFHPTGFEYRKGNQYTILEFEGSDSLEVSLDEDTDLDIALKKLNIYQHRKEIRREYNRFLYEELPRLYGLPAIISNIPLDTAMDMYKNNFRSNEEARDFYETHIGLQLKQREKAISVLPYEINKFITNLLKKYYEMEKGT